MSKGFFSDVQCPLKDPVASQLGDIGHGCETLAFVINYAVLRNNATLLKEAWSFSYA